MTGIGLRIWRTRMIPIDDLRLVAKHSRAGKGNRTILPGTSPSIIARRAKVRTSEVKDFIRGDDGNIKIRNELIKAGITKDDLIVAKIMLKHQKPRLWEL